MTTLKVARWAPRLRRRDRRSAGEGSAPRKLALVLSGGATRGAFQVGVIDVLARRGIRPDVLIGTSVGAINAAYWAFHPGPDVGARLLEAWHEAGAARVLPDRPLRIVGNLIGSRLHERHTLARVLERQLPEPTVTIESARLPLRIVACNLSTGLAVAFQSGTALPALLASAAVPGVFPPVVIDGEPYADGGVVANCPLETAREEGATDVLAIDLVGRQSRWEPAGRFASVERAVNVSLASQTRLALDGLRGNLRIALLRPHLDLPPGFGDFSQTLTLFGDGQRAAEQFLAAHWRDDRTVVPGELEFASPHAALAVGELPARDGAGTPLGPRHLLR
ncbi:MAG: patatin-like phospholipase family protein, partial [Candidatus Dormibacteraceae bacterium]